MALLPRVRGNLESFHKRSWKAVGGLLVVLIEEVAVGLGRKGLLALWDWLRELRERPLGEGGVLVVAALVFSLIWAAVDPIRLWRERLIRKAGTLVQRKLPREEAELVQDVRTIWNRYGEAAAGSLRDLFGLVVVPEIRNKNYLADLLDIKGRALARSADVLGEAVALDSVLGIEEVRIRFNSMYAEYLEVCKWVARIAKADVDLTTPEKKWRINKWRELHAVFYDKLCDLVERPAHHGTLKIFVGPGMLMDEDFKQFLAAAEASTPQLKFDQI